MAKLIYFFRAAFQAMRARPLVHGVAVAILAVALFAGGLARYLFLFVDHFFESFGREAEVTIYLRPEVSAGDAKAFFDRVVAQGVGEARLIQPREALERLRLELAEGAGVLANLPKNPLPAAIEIRPEARLARTDALEPFLDGWTRAPEVESIDYGREWLEKFEALAATARRLGALTLCLVLVAALVVCAITLQLAIYSRREEIELLELVGATAAFVKAPFLVEGMIQGVLATALATLGLFAVDAVLAPPVEAGLAFLLGESGLPPFVTLKGFLATLAAGLAVGLLGSLIAVRRFLGA